MEKLRLNKLEDFVNYNLYSAVNKSMNTEFYQYKVMENSDSRTSNKIIQSQVDNQIIDEARNLESSKLVKFIKSKRKRLLQYKENYKQENLTFGGIFLGAIFASWNRIDYSEINITFGLSVIISVILLYFQLYLGTKFKQKRKLSLPVFGSNIIYIILAGAFLFSSIYYEIHELKMVTEGIFIIQAMLFPESVNFKWNDHSCSALNSTDCESITGNNCIYYHGNCIVNKFFLLSIFKDSSFNFNVYNIFLIVFIIIIILSLLQMHNIAKLTLLMYFLFFIFSTLLITNYWYNKEDHFISSLKGSLRSLLDRRNYNFNSIISQGLKLSIIGNSHIFIATRTINHTSSMILLLGIPIFMNITMFLIYYLIFVLPFHDIIEKSMKFIRIENMLETLLSIEENSEILQIYIIFIFIVILMLNISLLIKEIKIIIVEIVNLIIEYYNNRSEPKLNSSAKPQLFNKIQRFLERETVNKQRKRRKEITKQKNVKFISNFTTTIYFMVLIALAIIIYYTKSIEFSDISEYNFYEIIIRKLMAVILIITYCWIFEHQDDLLVSLITLGLFLPCCALLTIFKGERVLTESFSLNSLFGLTILLVIQYISSLITITKRGQLDPVEKALRPIMGGFVISSTDWHRIYTGSQHGFLNPFSFSVYYYIIVKYILFWCILSILVSNIVDSQHYFSEHHIHLIKIACYFFSIILVFTIFIHLTNYISLEPTSNIPGTIHAFIYKI